MATTVNNTSVPESHVRRHARILIVGLGNDLLMDDGVGVHIARRLRQEKLGRGVMAVEVGTAVLDALHLFERADYVLAIDAMQAGHAPGTIYELDHDDIQHREQVSMHDFTFTSALTLLRKQPRQIRFIGVEPGTIEYGLEVTPAVAASVETAVESVKRFVERWNESAEGLCTNQALPAPFSKESNTNRFAILRRGS